MAGLDPATGRGTAAAGAGGRVKPGRDDMRTAAPPRAAGSIRNAMTVDVEDYFQVYAFSHVIPRASWETTPTRVEANVERILALFAAHGAKATFFTLGWIAQRHPGLIRRIVAEGHELASHGWDHTRADAQDPETFRDDVSRTRALLQDIGGVPVIGYRAATFSIGARNLWAFRVLAETGHRYSSSINPIRHDLYGMPNAPRTPFRPGGGALWEFPMTTVRLGGHNFPCSGGGYFRLLPTALYRAGLARVNRRERMPGIFYFHPWEVDPGQPRIAGCGWKSRLRHYTNLGRMQAELAGILRDFRWDRMDRVYAPLLAETPPDALIPPPAGGATREAVASTAAEGAAMRGETAAAGPASA